MESRIVLVFLIFIFSHISYGNNVFNGASWISVPESEARSNQWICFRKQIYCMRQETNAVLNIAVDSKYWLWVNNQMVIFEGGLKRGPNPTDTYYDHVDISAYLKEGINTIAIQVWYWGKDGYCHKDSGRAGLLVDLKVGNHFRIFSDGSWKMRIHPAFGESSLPHPNYRLPESNIHFDARKDMEGWQNEGYDDKIWKHAVVCGTYPCIPWNKVHLRPFPNWKDSGILRYDSLKWKRGDRKWIGFLPRNISVTPYLKVKSDAGKLIDIRSDNYRGGSEYNVRAEYVTKDGVQCFEALNYMNGHSIIYTIPKDVEVLELGYRETRFNTEFIGSFACDDSFYNILWNKALNTMNLNMRDAIQDPDRERSQWWGDAVIVSGEIYYACDSNGKLAVKKAIDNLVNWQKTNGVLYSPIPTGSWDKELPMQMLASVGKYGFWNYFVYTGDTMIIKKVYPVVKKYLSLWKFDEYNLICHRSGGWDWADWGQDIDVVVVENAWYSLALEGLKNMSIVLGEFAVAEECLFKMKRLKESVNRYCWNGRLYRGKNYNGRTDDRANALAVLAGFATDSQWQSIREYLSSYQAASPYMEKYILESFFYKGDVEGGLRRMKSRYKCMVDHSLTTLWEDWTIGGAGGGSINHGWAGGPLNLLSRYVAGIMPINSGWKTFLIKPMLGNLKKIYCTVPLDKGTVTLKINELERFIKIDCDVKRSFELALSKDWIEQAKFCTINGRKYITNKLKHLHKKQLAYKSEDESYIYMNVYSNEIEIRFGV